MVISEKKIQSLHEEMVRLHINESDLQEQFVLGSGKGGQKIQKTHSCVVLKHIPTGIEIKCQKSRSREENRFFARRLLCERVATSEFGEKTVKQQELDKLKKQKARRARRSTKKKTKES